MTDTACTNTTGLTGEQFNEIYKNKKFYKLSPEKDEYDNNGRWIEFDETKVVGEMYLSRKITTYKDDFYEIYHGQYYKYIQIVTIPNDAILFVHENTYKTSKIILSEKVNILDSDIWKNVDECKQIIEHYGMSIKLANKSIITEEMCVSAVNDEGYNLKYMAEEFKTYEVCNAAIINNSNSFKYVPKHIQTDVMCKFVLGKNNNNCIKYIENEFRTYDNFKLSILNCWTSLSEIDQSEELCILSIETHKGTTFQFVKKENQTNLMCEIAVKLCGHNLSYIRSDLITKKICKLAINKDSKAIKYTPFRYRIGLLQ
jgi:hypothetical protein